MEGYVEFVELYDIKPVAIHFKRLHTYPGMLKEFTVIIFTSDKALQEFDMIPFVKTLEYGRYPTQYRKCG